MNPLRLPSHCFVLVLTFTTSGSVAITVCASSISRRQPCTSLQPKRRPLPSAVSLCFSVVGHHRSGVEARPHAPVGRLSQHRNPLNSLSSTSFVYHRFV